MNQTKIRAESGEKTEIVKGSGNVFTDLGFDNPEEELLKVKIAFCVNEAISQLDWTQTKTAEFLGISQPQVSNLSTGMLKYFSVERLLNLMAKLDYDVSIHFIPKENSEIAKTPSVVSV